VRIILQASSRTWSGGPDYCLAEVDGRPAIDTTLDVLHEEFPHAEMTIVAPGFDRGGELERLRNGNHAQGLHLSYSHDASPLDRMIEATADLDPDEHVLRVDGAHFATDPRLARNMLEAASAGGYDCVKPPDDFSPKLGSDVYRVGALRRAGELISDAESRFRVHPKFFMFAHPETFQCRHYDELPEYPDELLMSIRERTIQVEREVVTTQSIPVGDQITFHYDLALRHLEPRMRVLDIAAGTGWGSRLLAEHCREVHAADLDAVAIAAGASAPAPANLHFQVCDCLEMPYEPGFFDAVVSCETLEHVPAEAFLREVDRVLAPEGVLIVSTPQNRLGHIPLIPAHTHEFSLEELRWLVDEVFDIEVIYGLKAGIIFLPGDPTGTNTVVVARKRG
jgi:2-polyprenyl-3-methyl-5-hydroxy-6-metoxy-1,4-benzoquinol methylase